MLNEYKESRRQSSTAVGFNVSTALKVLDMEPFKALLCWLKIWLSSLMMQTVTLKKAYLEKFLQRSFVSLKKSTNPINSNLNQGIVGKIYPLCYF